MGIGPNAGYLLRLWGAHVDRAFGDVPFQVGSSLTQKHGWRDVDVRVLVDDERFDVLWSDAPVRRLHEMAWSAFGQQFTGLPIDFQIQRLTDANAEFSGVRSALVVLASELPTVDDR